MVRIMCREERLALAHLSFDMARAFHAAHFPAARFGAMHELRAVGTAIFIGQAEGRPMGLSRLSRFLDMPRATVQRKLEVMIAYGVIERKGRVYCIREDRLNGPHISKALAKLAPAVRRAAQKMPKVGN